MASWFSNLKDKVQSSVNIDPDLIKKITLQSPDLAAERTKIDNEQRRKEAVRDTLSEILPWETRDSEMEILVDECRDVILSLSSRKETFTGPFVLPGGLSTREKDDDDEEDGDLRAARDVHEAEKSAEKLAKLQPLPSLLANFDLDAHVGLIQRLFEADPKLVEIHSRLSSGGKREVAFWKNYFFHCAYARYEAGLSIDEIWSNEPKASRGAAAAKKEEGGFDIVDSRNACASEEEVGFDAGVTPEDAKMSKAEAKQSSYNVTTSAQPVNELNVPNTLTDSLDIPLNDSVVDTTGGTGYEFVANTNADEGEIDELEAEIAAALGD